MGRRPNGVQFAGSGWPAVEGRGGLAMRRLLMQLGGLYAVAVVVFCAAGVFHDRPDWAQATRSAANDVRDTVVAWTSDTADSVHGTVTAWLDRQTSEPPPLRGTQSEDRAAPKIQPVAPSVVAAPKPQTPAKPTDTQVAAAPESTSQSPASDATQPTPEQQAPDTQVAEAQPAKPSPPPAEYGRLSPSQIARVRERLRASLSADLWANFDLFLYVSKADHGPWAQRMFVFAKESDSLRLMHAWPVSTGREETEPDAHGHLRITATPTGYYQLDPSRMMREHHSSQWDSPMPFSMFFNWIRKGSATGLAIHGVEGDEIALLGTRASAGCVRLSPESAENLFNLIRENYRGEVPRFATDHRRYSTTSNQGELMRDRDGELVLANGYRVLVYIDNYGGDELVSALY